MGFIRSNMKTVPMYDAPTKKNRPSIPNIPIIGPDIEGPITLAPPIKNEYMTMAFKRCFAGTKLGTIACLLGMSNATRIPYVVDKNMRCQGCIKS